MFRSAAQTTFAVPHQPEYEHVQSGPLLWILLAPAIVMMALLATVLNDAEATLGMIAVACVLLATAFSFQSLRVVDEGDVLAIRFGPLPVFRKRIPYAEIANAERDRTSIVDGWGIHWVPGRGWTYNLWGFDCVRLTLANGRTVRVGTDDPDGLAHFLQTKCRVSG